MTDTSGRTRQTGVTLDAAKVRHEMAIRGWSQGDLAAHAHVSQMTISNVLAGKPVHPRTARQIAQAFDSNPPVLNGWLEQRAS